MTGTSLLNAVGINPEYFPQISSRYFTLYDSKDRIVEKEEVIFAEELFLNNPEEDDLFFKFLLNLEETPSSPINIKIDERFVIIYYNTKNSIAFSRKKSMNPIDYMD